MFSVDVIFVSHHQKNGVPFNSSLSDPTRSSDTPRLLLLLFLTIRCCCIWCLTMMIPKRDEVITSCKFSLLFFMSYPIIRRKEKEKNIYRVSIHSPQLDWLTAATQVVTIEHMSRGMEGMTSDQNSNFSSGLRG